MASADPRSGRRKDTVCMQVSGQRGQSAHQGHLKEKLRLCSGTWREGRSPSWGRGDGGERGGREGDKLAPIKGSSPGHLPHLPCSHPYIFVWFYLGATADAAQSLAYSRLCTQECVRTPWGCQGYNPGWPCASQEPNPLCYLPGPHDTPHTAERV